MTMLTRNDGWSVWALVLLAGLPSAIAFGAASKPAGSDFDPQRILREAEDGKADGQADRSKLEEDVDRSDDPLDQAQAQLALANWWLSVPTARPATRWILAMHTPADLEAVSQAARKAGEQLDRARAALKKADPSDQEGNQRKRKLADSADYLQAFAGVLRDAEVGTETESDRQKWHDAGRGLAVAREADKEDLAAAALLWHAFALEQAGNRERALEMLPNALARPEVLPYDLMSRLLRCRLIADSGRQPAAVTLLSRMELALKDWMTNKNQQRNNARRLIGLVQYRIVSRWAQRLRADTRPGAADPLQPVLEKVENDFTSVKKPGLYFMTTAVPLLVSTEPSRESAAAAKPASMQENPSPRD